MAKWKVEPTEIKSIVEVEYYVKGKNKLRVETGWRWGSFYVYTEDNTPPVFDPEVNIYDSGYKVELIETNDNCWTDIESDECDKKTQKWLDEFLEENDVSDLDSEGWRARDSETFITCDVDVELVEGDVPETTEE